MVPSVRATPTGGPLLVEEDDIDEAEAAIVAFSSSALPRAFDDRGDPTVARRDRRQGAWSDRRASHRGPGDDLRGGGLAGGGSPRRVRRWPAERSEQGRGRGVRGSGSGSSAGTSRPDLVVEAAGESRARRRCRACARRTVGRRPSASHAGHDGEPRLPAGDGGVGVVPAEVADDRAVGERPRSGGGAGACCPTPRARRRWSAGRRTASSCRSRSTRRRGRRAGGSAPGPGRAVEEPGMADLDGVAVAGRQRREEGGRARRGRAGPNDAGSWIERAAGPVAERVEHGGGTT